MREIKFRSWNVETKEMEYMDANKTLPLPAFFSLESGRFRIFLQFTGLTDKKGTEIYEGDFLVFDRGFDFESSLVKIVEHQIGCFGYAPVYPEREHIADRHWSPFYGESSYEDIENGESPENAGDNKCMAVVGNIYEGAKNGN